MIPATTGVLVIGGGPVGLVASGLLSRLGVPNVVIERRPEPLQAPAAHVLRDRPMEILSLLGLGEEIRRAVPKLPLRYVLWCTSLGGREIGRLDLRKDCTSDSEVWTHCPQNLLEPILRTHASRQPEAHVVPGAECRALTQTARNVRARIGRADGSEGEIEAAWAIAADGAGSSTRAALGIPMLGHGPIGRFFMVHFEADLTPVLRERPTPIAWILDPEAPGVLIVHEPEKSHVFMTPVFGHPGEEATLPGRLAKALGGPALARILAVRPWSPHVQVAQRYRQGRIFLAGDAAHRFPPTGGLGLNTGILDVHNLVWRLAMVVSGKASDGLLDGYEAECRPVAEANASASFENLLRLGEISRAIGTWPDRERLGARLEAMSACEREALAAAIDAQREHFFAAGPLPEPAGGDPRLPVSGWSAACDRFTLRSGPGEAWEGVAREVAARLGIPVDARQPAPDELRRLPASFPAFLTRPDGVVAWVDPGRGTPGDLERGLRQLLAPWSARSAKGRRHG